MNEQQQRDMNEQVTITLPLGAWQVALQILQKGPWETVDPLLRAIAQQLQGSQATHNGEVQ